MMTIVIALGVLSALFLAFALYRAASHARQEVHSRYRKNP